MAKHNVVNARIKGDYFHYLKEANRRNETSIDAVAKALAHFEEANVHKDFRNFHRQQAEAFKRKLASDVNTRSGQPLSRSTVNSTLSALRAFFVWLADKPDYKSRLAYADADYFKLSERDTRIAKAVRIKAFPTQEQVHQVLATMPTGSDIELRNRALIAFALLTGARDGALATFRLKHVDLVQGRVDQDARDVHTREETFPTWFFRLCRHGASTCASTCYAATIMRCFRQHKSGLTSMAALRPLACGAMAGTVPDQSAPYSNRHLRQLVCPISTRIPSALR
jgi:site-specific recombinase XerC